MKALSQRAGQLRRTLQNESRIWWLAQRAKAAFRKAGSLQGAAQQSRPVLFFNASTRLQGVSLNGAFAFLASCGLQMDGVPVVHFACQAGMAQCQLGAVVTGVDQAPPCARCVLQTRTLTSNAPVHWFQYRPDPRLIQALEGKTVDELSAFEFDGMPLGTIVLPSTQWVLRRFHLFDDELTRRLLGRFILSAHSLALQFRSVLDQVQPQAVVVFNGLTYPEATARWVALQRGLRVITHEVAHQPMTAFFSDGHVTAYPVDIPAEFELSEAQNAQLDGYLAQRLKGDFSMAGIRFWPELQDLDAGLLDKISQFKQLVPVFSNVIFDTSQVHANTVFPHMFAWLDQVHDLARRYPETLFVLRAHPDEMRPGKTAQESVRSWVQASGLAALPNVVYIDALEYLSSYALIHRAKFVMVYNSTIGLEAVLMGKPVLNGGSARYTRHQTVYLPETPAAHLEMAESFLLAEQVVLPEAFYRNARRFQYYQLYKTPLPFGSFLEVHGTQGYVYLKDFLPEALHPDQSPTMRVIRDGILAHAPFLMDD